MKVAQNNSGMLHTSVPINLFDHFVFWKNKGLTKIHIRLGKIKF